jgi:hypothetical protein
MKHLLWFVMLQVAGASAWAQSPGKDACTILDTDKKMPEERRQVEPLIDHPLKDPSICKGPDGWYYLTGTDGTPILGKGVDFDNNDGVRVWKSKDLKNWELVGKVMDLSIDITAKQRAQDHPLGWWRRPVGKPGLVDSPMVRYVQAPEIHYLKGTFWLTYSISGEGTGLLKSQTGKAEGPYEPWGVVYSRGDKKRKEQYRFSFKGGSASLFEDDDGAVYWFYGDGLIARLKDDLTGFAETPRQLLCENPEKTGEYFMDYPRKVGRDGYYLIKRDGVYYLFATDFANRAGESCEDVYVAASDNIYGPYCERAWSIPNCGQTTLFEGPDGRLMATYCGNDRHAAFRDRPGIVPMGMSINVHSHDYPPKQPLPRRLLNVNTERYLWHKLAPVTDFIRDVYACVGKDGAIYYTGSHTGTKTDGKFFVYRSMDMVNWEPIEVWDWDKQKKLFTKPYPDPRQSKRDGVFSYMDAEIWPLNGTFYVGYSCYGGTPGSFLLRSISGKAAGPYEYVAPGLGQNSYFQDDDKKIYYGSNNSIREMKPDMSGTVHEKPERWVNPADSSSRYDDCAGSMMKWNGKYVFFRCGQSAKGRQLNTLATPGCYVWNYMVAPSLDGPWSRERVVGPHTGHSGVPVQDRFGNWWIPFFGTAASDCMPCWGMECGGMHPVEIAEESGELIIKLTDKLPEYVEKALMNKDGTQ